MGIEPTLPQLRYWGPASTGGGYAEHDASIVIETLEILGGSLPHRAQRLVAEWAELHRDELLANWQRARDEQPLDDIEPLP